MLGTDPVRAWLGRTWFGIGTLGEPAGMLGAPSEMLPLLTFCSTLSLLNECEWCPCRDGTWDSLVLL